MFIKEKLMSERIYHLPNIMALFCIGIDPLGADIVVSNMTELEGRR